MKRINMHDAKTNLSRYIAELGPGESLLVCNRNEPVAELRALNNPKNRPVKLGVAKGEFKLADDFFEPLPDELLKAFNGQ